MGTLKSRHAEDLEKKEANLVAAQKALEQAQKDLEATEAKTGSVSTFEAMQQRVGALLTDDNELEDPDNLPRSHYQIPQCYPQSCPH